jgi:hypothetical protein
MVVNEVDFFGSLFQTSLEVALGKAEVAGFFRFVSC